MNTQVKNIIDSFDVEFGRDEIDQASNNAQDELQSLLTNGVEVTIEDGDVMVSAPQRHY